MSQFFLKNSKKSTILILFLSLLLSPPSFSYVTLPFTTIAHTLHAYDSNVLENILQNFMNSTLFTRISLGNPPKFVNFILSFNNFATFFFENCISVHVNVDFAFKKENEVIAVEDSKIKEKKYNYKYTESDTFKQEIDYFYGYSNGDMNFNVTVGSEVLFLDKNSGDIREINGLKMMFSGGDKGGKSECGVIGLLLRPKTFLDKPYNFIQQLKALDYIDTYTWYIIFDKKDNNKEYLMVGTLPHERDSENYNVKNLYYSGAINNEENTYYWTMELDEIYYTVNKEENGKYIESNVTMERYKQISFDYSLNWVVAPYEYYSSIKSSFFDSLISQELCKIEYGSLEFFYTFSCLKTPETLEKIARFPTLNFLSKKLHKNFSLNYTELFFLEHQKIYFKVLFINGEFNPSFRLGKVFLRKYQFVFDYERKSVGFYNMEYNNNINDNNNNNNNNIKNNEIKYNICEILIVLSIIGAAALGGYFLGRKKQYENRRKKANEMEDEFDYYKERTDKKSEKFLWEKA